MKAAVVLGAGFSKNSGIPIQSEIPDLLVSQPSNDIFEQSLTLILEKFMSYIFGYEKGSEKPEIDDIFTCIDISTNSGHHLGINYSPVHLRALRRFLVYRVFSILESGYNYSEDIFKLISGFHKKFDEVRYVVMNWDTVLEKYLSLAIPGFYIDYCNNGLVFGGRNKDNHEANVEVLKIHGSLNWLYCDNCRLLFNDLHNDTPLRARAGIIKSDFKLFDELKKLAYSSEIPGQIVCGSCENTISSHIATFSYRKSFRANSFPGIWSRAEEVLADSDRWIFIGYSLPEADYEFKHLIKIAELKLDHKRQSKVKIDVILSNSEGTVSKFKKLFGKKLDRICNNGIGEYLNYLD